MQSRAPSVHRARSQVRTTSPPTASNPTSPNSSTGSAPSPKVTLTLDTTTGIIGHRNTVVVSTAAASTSHAQQTRLATVMANGLKDVLDLQGRVVEVKLQQGVRVVGSGNLIVLAGGGGGAGGAAAGTGTRTGTVTTSVAEDAAGMSGEKRRRV
ncbi:hypothetical protein MMC18_007694 [Xylographa bjoerkii]|nr:hypothetical protein [Xylographa bjoerkii]